METLTVTARLPSLRPGGHERGSLCMAHYQRKDDAWVQFILDDPPAPGYMPHEIISLQFHNSTGEGRLIVLPTFEQMQAERADRNFRLICIGAAIGAFCTFVLGSVLHTIGLF